MLLSIVVIIWVNGVRHTLLASHITQTHVKGVCRKIPKSTVTRQAPFKLMYAFQIYKIPQRNIVMFHFSVLTTFTHRHMNRSFGITFSPDMSASLQIRFWGSAGVQESYTVFA